MDTDRSSHLGLGEPFASELRSEIIVPSLKRELCDISTFLGLCFHSSSGVASACVRAQSLHSRLFVALRTVALQAPLSMGFSRQEYWSGLSFPLPGNLRNSGIKPVSLYVSCIGRQVLDH